MQCPSVRLQRAAWRPAGRPARALAAPRCQGAGEQALQQAASLPYVNWTRYNQHLLFVDRSDTVRGRFAVGMLERIVDWNGHGRTIIGLQCGLDAQDGSSIDLSTAAGLMAVANAWRIRPRLFASTRQTFEPEDIDRFDLIIALDASIQAEVQAQLSAFRPAATQQLCRVCCLTDFAEYAREEDLLRDGGHGLLDKQLRFIMRSHLGALRPAAAEAPPPEAAPAEDGASSGDGGVGVEQSKAAAAALANNAVALPPHLLPTSIPRPSLQAGDGEWEEMFVLLALCCAGLMKYLLDEIPPDLPDYDPL